MTDAAERPLAETIERANRRVMEIMQRSRPVWTDVGPALDYLPGMHRGLVLHAGPPIEWERMCRPQRDGIIAAVLHEGLAASEEEARARIVDGSVCYAPCHEYGAVGGMAGITSASSPVAVVRDMANDTVGYSQLFQGPGVQIEDRDRYHEAAVRQWRWLARVLGPALREAVRASGGIEVGAITARALEMGDECHNRNSAGTALLLSRLLPWLIAAVDDPQARRQAIDYLCGADQFSLCVSMAAGKALSEAMSGVSHSTVVHTMARNGVDFGIRVSGTGPRWYTAPANRVEGIFFSAGCSAADALPDMGDSSIMETVGLGGHVQAAAPALQQFVGGSFARGCELSREMATITAGALPDYRIPNLDFEAAPAGIDIRKVVNSGVTPVIDTAIAHYKGGVIGAGQTRAPLDCFKAALRAFAAEYRRAGA